jgi:hypothetical protein
MARAALADGRASDNGVTICCREQSRAPLYSERREAATRSMRHLRGDPIASAPGSDRTVSVSASVPDMTMRKTNRRERIVPSLMVAGLISVVLSALVAMTKNRKETSMKKLQTFFIACLAMIWLMPATALGKPNEQQAAKSVPLKITVNIKDGSDSYYIPVTVRVSTAVLAMAQANSREKQIAYVTRILQQNTENLRTVTEGFKHFGDVRLYLDVEFDPGPDAHIHSPQGEIGAKKICGRICCTNSDGKQCCSVIICPVDRNGNCAC